MKNTQITYFIPIRTAPSVSKIVARIQACFKLSTPEPTLVPKLFATSFAPIPKARINETIKDKITIHSIVGSILKKSLNTANKLSINNTN